MATESGGSPPVRAVDGRETFRAAVVVGALGVVFGDIGTSPIYTIQTVFNPKDPHPVPISTNNVYGVVSLIFWSVMIIVTVTYVLLVMRVDNDGEGGIMALITLLRRLGGVGGASRDRGAGRSRCLRRRAVLRRQRDHTRDFRAVRGGRPEGRPAGTGGADCAAHGGDHRGIVLRAAARHGGGRSAVRAGDVRLVRVDRCVRCDRHCPTSGNSSGALATYALNFMFGHFGIAFFALTAVVLAVTGAEALYADMGHFGRPAITQAGCCSFYRRAY